MIEAKKNRAFEWMFSLYNTWLLRTSFHRLYVRGHVVRTPALYVANHSSWWDGLMAFQLSRFVFQQNSYAMMSEEGLEQYPFFRKLGGFSVNRTQRKEVVKSLDYAISLLRDGKSVWMFPQGEEQHIEKRPLQFFTGAVYVAERANVPIVPLAFYHSFRHHRKPEWFIHIGEPLRICDVSGSNRKEKTAELERICTAQLDDVRRLVITEQLQTFRCWDGGKL